MKSIKKQFDDHFDFEKLKLIFNENIIFSGAVGVDNVNTFTFVPQQDEQIRVISRKVIAGTYKFSKYKLSLVSKGRGKAPRELSIPTVRDRIALRALCDFLQTRFSDSVNQDLPQVVISRIKNDVFSGNYSGVIKLDVTNFYPSVNHDILEKKLNKRLSGHQNIKNVIFSAIKSPTVDISKKDDELNELGVPQGLSISNILASIYLQDLDKYLSSISNSKSYRYVDDILILCDHKESEKIADDVIKKFKDNDLVIHEPSEFSNKSTISKIQRDFDYLGYLFKNKTITVRAGSVEKLKSSLVGHFTGYKYSKNKNVDFLRWCVDLRVTGCIKDNKCKGWLFFFSEINDEALLHTLDHFVKKLCKRFSVDMNNKKFVRAFKEIQHKKYSSRYIPNFDEYDLDQQDDVLREYFGYDTSKLTNEEVNYIFNKKINRQIRDLESDIKDHSVSG